MDPLLQEPWRSGCGRGSSINIRRAALLTFLCRWQWKTANNIYFFQRSHFVCALRSKKSSTNN